MEGEFVDAEKCHTSLAEIFDRKPKYREKQQHRIDDPTFVTLYSGIRRIEVQRVVERRQSRKQDVVRFGQRSPPMVVELTTGRGVLVVFRCGPGNRARAVRQLKAPRSSSRLGTLGGPRHGTFH